MAESFEIRCHHCGNKWIGESSRVMRFVGQVESPRLRELAIGPRDSWRCKSCGWVSIFVPAESETKPRAGWRAVEVKTG